MKLRISTLIVLGALVIAPACGDGSDGGGATEALDPIGAPDTPVSGSSSTSGRASVAKQADVQMDVPKKELNSAAQSVIDLASSDEVGGFLVSSVVDTTAGYGAADIVVKVPSPTFERVVADLHTIGNISRHELEGQDLSDSFLTAHARIRQVQSRIASLLRRLENTDDRAARFELRSALHEAKDRRTELAGDKAYIQGITTYSVIEVGIDGRQPPPPPVKPAFDRSLETAKNISMSIGSGVILAAGVVVPLGLVALILYLLAAPIVRRLRSVRSSNPVI